MTAQLTMTLQAKQKRPARRRSKRVRGKTKQLIRLSPTTGLNLFGECPRCFWLHHNERVRRPQGPFPSLPGGMDLIIKEYFDRYRGGLPPELIGKLPGVLVSDRATMERWRNWRSGLVYKDEQLNAELFGALDDCLIDPDGRYLPLDFKTRGSAPRDGQSEAFYQAQLDSYTLMLAENGYPVGEAAYLVYFFPERMESPTAVRFHLSPVRVSVSAERARRLFADAVRLLRGPLPKRHSGCEYCRWTMVLEEFD